MTKQLVVLVVALGLVVAAWSLQRAPAGPLPTYTAAPEPGIPTDLIGEQSAGGADRSAVPDDRSRPQWLLDLLYGEADGAMGYFAAVSAVGDGTLSRVTVGSEILSDLARDNGGPARLRNVLLPVALLIEDLRPAAPVLAARDAYLGLHPASSLHADFMVRLRSWPINGGTAAEIEGLLQKLDGASPDELRRLMEHLLALGPAAAKALTRTLVARIAQDGSKAMTLVFGLLDAQAKPDVLAMFMFDTAVTQWRDGNERASDTVNLVGVAFRTYLGGGLGSTVGIERAQVITRALIDAATATRVEHAVGLGVTVAISLGGGMQDDPMIAAFLAEASHSWPALAGNTALVNLGSAASPADYLAYVPWPLSPPTDRERMVRHADYLSGLAVALQRHPDQEGHVLPYFTDALRKWQSGTFEILMSEAVMRLVREMNIRGATPVLEELRSGPNRRLANFAAAILDEWK